MRHGLRFQIQCFVPTLGLSLRNITLEDGLKLVQSESILFIKIGVWRVKSPDSKKPKKQKKPGAIKKGKSLPAVRPLTRVGNSAIWNSKPE